MTRIAARPGMSVDRIICALAALAAVVGSPAPVFAQDADACISASEQSLTARKAGKLIDARKALATCAATVCPDPIRSSCQQRMSEVTQALPSIVFDVKDPSGGDLSAASLDIDKLRYADHLDGRAIVLDPGDHEFTFTATGQAPLVRHYVLREGEHDRHEAILIGTPLAAPTAGPALARAPALGPAEVLPENAGRAQRISGLVLGGVGSAGLIVGSIFGLVASSKWNSSQSECPSPGNCTQHAQAVTDHDSATSSATISTVALTAGGAALVAGAIVFFSAPSSGVQTPRAVGLVAAPDLEPGGGGLTLLGQF